MDRVMWWMNAMNIATLAATRTNATVTDSCGTNAPPPSKSPRTERSTVSA